MHALILALALHTLAVATLAAPTPKPKPTVRVFIFTARPRPGEFAPPDLKARADSVQDVGMAICRTVMDVKFEPAGRRENAHVFVEVLGRELDPRREGWCLVHLKISARGKSWTVDGAEDGWRGAAEDAAKQIHAWARFNRHLILGDGE
ncbi:MAG TPA: hypothetical protein VGK32_17615 [Vicinamibacterales bacterium]|jgi:hypothetical protein